ncbi:MAG: ATP-dependent sacrificial sulfur transferase LarE [Acetivibrionales bacterium]|jgi:uncharacterized protein|nr:ATP-dependent sacrificial sulfur transferase LarE [Clostridiaceae bacterium]
MELNHYFKLHPHVAIAFSGGVDSAYLLYAATKFAEKVHAYYVKSAFQPQFELDEAKRMAKQLRVDMTVIEVDVLQCSEVTANPADRCYFCKKHIFTNIAEQAHKDGYNTLLDGTNASDDADDRPGMKALKELSVLSPLRECGLTKEEIRRQSKEAGLFTWDKPAYACLATRIPTGEPITKEKLECTERAEDFLFSLGFTDFRVRMPGTAAKLQTPASQIEKVIENRTAIVQELKRYYSAVTLDLEGRNE